jgi:hypothetical protein
MKGFHKGNHNSWLHIQLTATAVKQTALCAAWLWLYDRNMLWQWHWRRRRIVALTDKYLFNDRGACCKVWLDCPTTPIVQSRSSTSWVKYCWVDERWTAWATFSRRHPHRSCVKVGLLCWWRSLRVQNAGSYSLLRKYIASGGGSGYVER